MSLLDIFKFLQDGGAWAVVIFLSSAIIILYRSNKKENEEHYKQMLTLVEDRAKLEEKILATLENMAESIKTLVNKP